MTDAPQTCILLGLNEVNFEYVRKYADQGLLPTFKKLMETVPVVSTSSEQSYHEFEPWIQWVSIQTGKTFSEHGIFRLGDVVHKDVSQIWEYLEQEKGLKVGAVSPMNADNRCKNPAFFIPDPWTRTSASGSLFIKMLSRALSNAVNENATGRSRLSTYIMVFLGVMRYSLPRRGPEIMSQIFKALRSHYQRAILLDQLLTDIFLEHWEKHRPDFASLFLNGCAHLQHHYLFNSAHYNGPNENPSWYMQKGRDPVLNGYRAYDEILDNLMSLEEAPRIIIATGLHQTPVAKPVYYWRLKDHSAFLNRLGIDHLETQARMSRDFLIICADETQAENAVRILESCTDQNGISIFGDIDNRGTSVFVSLMYPHDITEDTQIQCGNQEVRDFAGQVGFVALKNGEHDGQGYVLDTGNGINTEAPFPITGIFNLIDGHFGQIKTAEKLAA